MVTICIIEDLANYGVTYEIDKYKGNSLWLTDNTTIIANSIESLETNIETLKTSARQYGLEINEDKTKIKQTRDQRRSATLR